MNKFSATWHQDDVVSTPGIGVPVIGKVVVLKRDSDGRPYRKVQITSGGALGRWVWPDGWVLGAGPFGRTCLQCGQRFQTDDRTEVLCPACTRDERQSSTVPETRSIHGSLYGARTPRKPAPSAAAVAVPDDFEDPFSTDVIHLPGDGEDWR